MNKIQRQLVKGRLATNVAAAGVPEKVIMAQTGHKSERMARRYIREGDLFGKNVAQLVGI